MNRKSKEPIYIAGLGAIGCDIAAHICSGNYPCILLLKNDEQYTIYQQTGLTIKTLKSTYHCSPNATIIDQIDQKIEYLILCVKAYDIINAITRLQQHLNASSKIIIIHNGLGINEIIHARFPELRVITGISYVAAYSEKPFHVRSFMMNNYHFGPSLGHFNNEEIRRLKQILKRAHIPYLWINDISRTAWIKFAINCCINILTVYHDCKFSGLINHVKDLKLIIKETVDVVKLYNTDLTYDILLENILKLISVVGESYSSTYQDVKKSKQTELLYLNGHLKKLAHQNNIPATFNDYLLKTLKERGVII